MGQPEHSFPVADPGTQQKQLYIRDIEFLNYHINHDKWDWFRKFDVIDAQRFFDDFTYDEVDWYSTNLSAGASATVIDFINGAILFVTAATDNHYAELYQEVETWKLVDKYPLYFEIRFKVSESIQLDFYAGLMNANGLYANTPADGVWFSKDDGDQNIDFVVRNNTVDTTADTTEDLADLTWIRLGFHWDGHDTIRYFVIRDSDQYVLAAGSVTTGYAQDEEFNIAFGIRNGEAASKSMWVDYIKVVQSRIIA